ncbi:MAG: NADPH:quinone reductase [Burkholderiaceae bacterium]|nr:MAG: NADPH:quinone reductase [Burkholderiaceae bacterium]TAM02747.1 MAG: NADPH:quinone reductase [Pusillimonas sp.]
MSRVVRFHRLGGPEVLQIEKREIPAPGSNEVLIKVEAIGLNRADVMFRTGRYLEKATLPSQLGFEAAGTVLACGPGAQYFQVGDAVGTLPGFDLSRYGVYADHIVIPEAYVLRRPKDLSNVQAAALWMAYLTAYGGLIEAGRVRSGEWVLISAASSSVGLAAIQIARQAGARPIATTLTSANRDELLAAGACAVIATEDEPLGERLQKLAGGKLNCAFDAVGGPQVVQLAEAMAAGGRIVIHGALSPDSTPYPLKLALKKSLTLRGYVYTEVTTDAAVLARAQRFIVQGIETGTLQPHVDRTFSLADVIEAHQYLESNQQFGKIVLIV